MSALCCPIYFMAQVIESSFKMSTLRETPWSQGQAKVKCSFTFEEFWHPDPHPQSSSTVRMSERQEAKRECTWILCFGGLESAENWLSLPKNDFPSPPLAQLFFCSLPFHFLFFAPLSLPSSLSPFFLSFLPCFFPFFLFSF